MCFPVKGQLALQDSNGQIRRTETVCVPGVRELRQVRDSELQAEEGCCWNIVPGSLTELEPTSEVFRQMHAQEVCRRDGYLF